LRNEINTITHGLTPEAKEE